MNKIKEEFNQSHYQFKLSLDKYEGCLHSSSEFTTYLKAFLKSYEIFIENLIRFIVYKFKERYNEKIPTKYSNNMEKIKFIYEKVQFNEKEFKTLCELIRLRNKTVHEYDNVSSEKKREQTIESIKNKTSQFDYLLNTQQRALVVKEIDKMLPVLKKISNPKNLLINYEKENNNKKYSEEELILPISLKDASKILTVAGIVGIGLGATALGVAAVLKKFTEKK